MEDYLFLQPLLIERIQTKVSGFAHVGGLFNSGDIPQQSVGSPSCWVIYAGDNARDDRQKKNLVSQTWGVVLASRYPAREQTGVLLGQLINALADWNPAPHDSLPLLRAGDSMAVYFENDFLIVPLLFEAQFFWPRKETWKP